MAYDFCIAFVNEIELGGKARMMPLRTKVTKTSSDSDKREGPILTSNK